MTEPDIDVKIREAVVSHFKKCGQYPHSLYLGINQFKELIVIERYIYPSPNLLLSTVKEYGGLMVYEVLCEDHLVVV